MKKDKGFVQVYTGNGKGKTTAAFGAALRAAGHGKKCYIGQFMKGILYGEVTFLKEQNLINIEQYGDIECIEKDQVTEKHRKSAMAGIKRIREILRDHYDLVVLDEVNVAIWFGLISEDVVVDLIEEKPHDTEFILTGRYAPDAIIEKADLVTEMNEVKHYYSKGIMARDGFER